MELPFTTQKMKYLIRDMTASTPPCHKDPVSLLALQNFFYSPCHNTGAAPLFPQAVFPPIWWELVLLASKAKITHSLASESEGPG